jgi:hypothetical protein
MLLMLAACGSGNQPIEIWSESAVATLGAAIQATQGEGSVAWSRAPRRPTLWDRLKGLMDPFATAWAEAPPVCPTLVTTATCNGAVLQMLYENCFGHDQSSPSLRRSYVNLTFPSAALCASVAGTGFTSGTIGGLVGQAVVRTFGFGATQNTDQNNYAMAANSLVSTIYTAFPSGFTGDARQGGVSITFVDANTRKIAITGMHEIAETSPSFQYSEAATIDLNQVVGSATGQIYPWDHTLNSVENGDVPLTDSPPMSASGTGFTYGDDNNIVDSPVAPASGDATVVGFGPGATVKAGAAVRIQHNHSKSTSVSVVTQDLVFSNDNCCWPTSGAIHTEFDRFYSGQGTLPWEYEDLTFGPGCGQVTYTTSETNDTGLNMLYTCD